MEAKQRRAKVTKLRKGERLTIEITAQRKCVVVVRVPAGGTVRLQKSIPGLQQTADVT